MISATTNNGSVSVQSINGEQVTLRFTGGSWHRRVQTGGSYTPADSFTASTSCSNTVTSTYGPTGQKTGDSSTGSCPSSIYYNSGGYSGTLSRTHTTSSGSCGQIGPKNGTCSNTFTAYYSGTVYRPASDTRTYAYYYQYTVTLSYIDNQPPQLTLSDNLPSILSEYEGYNLLDIQGFVRDPDNDSVTVTATVAGHTKSTVITDTSVARQFQLTYDLFEDKIPNGTHTVTVTANDGKSGIDTKTFQITVIDFLLDNKYILVEDLVMMFTNYGDEEGDPLYLHQFKINHTPDHFEFANRKIGDPLVINPVPYEQIKSGQISHNNSWTNPVTQNILESTLVSLPNSYSWERKFSNVGHYEIAYRSNDIPIANVAFEEFRKWSSPTPVMNIYVHRKPVAVFKPYINPTNGNVTIIDLSYDLDSYSQGERGIQEKIWRHRQVGTTAWISGEPTNLNRFQTWEIELQVLDFQGEYNTSVATVSSGAIPNHRPVAYFDYLPEKISTTTETDFIDYSYDPDGDVLTHQWHYQRPSETIWRQFPSQYFDKIDAKMILNELGDWKIRKTVTDVRNPVSDQLSNSFERIITVNNQPPIPGFSLINTPYWVGEQASIINSTTDPDQDPLTIIYDLYYIEGATETLKETKTFNNVLHPYTFEFTFDYYFEEGTELGKYKIVQRVSDSISEDPSPASFEFMVNGFELTGEVHHTEKWQEWHTKLGNEPLEFYSGEIFILKANVSDYPVQWVEVKFEGEQVNGSMLRLSTNLSVTNSILWEGELFQESMLEPLTRLKDGSVKFTFIVKYANPIGTVKEYPLNIDIIGSAFEILEFHQSF